MRHGALALTAILLAAQPAHAQQQFHFTGETTASPVLIHDAMQNVAMYGRAALRCTDITAVESRVLPASYVPGNPQYRIGTGTVVREAWNVTLCGKQVRFLLTFWPDGSGGTMFGIGYPYPDDAP
jgi:hypothetical protein